MALVVSGEVMFICYIDEAGCTGALPAPSSAIQPVFALAGTFVKESHIKSLTNDLIQLKQRFFPKHLPTGSLYHDWITVEVKGSSLRNMARSKSRNDRRFAYMVIGSALDILEKHQVKVVGRVFIKPIGGQFNGSAVYSSTVQGICKTFQQFLAAKGEAGIVIADSRNKPKNANVSHSIFTQRYAATGDPYSRLVELPTFGHSDNHAALQLADLVCSALLFPIAAQVCAAAHLTDHTHCDPHYLNLKTRFGERLKDLQYRYQNNKNWWEGGVTLADPLNKLNASALFK